MNLKEAFRFQNKLQSLAEDALFILSRDANVTRVENTYLRKKVMPEVENETTVDVPGTDYAEQITEIAGFLIELLAWRETLSRAIRTAKNRLPMDMDSEIGLNGARQNIARTLDHLVDLRNSEVVIPHGGSGYRFNADGNQVAYKCDVKRVTTIHYDRNVIRRYRNEMHQKADAVSSEIDRCLVNTEVEFAIPFDVNASFAEVFDGYLAKQK